MQPCCKVSISNPISLSLVWCNPCVHFNISGFWQCLEVRCQKESIVHFWKHFVHCFQSIFLFQKRSYWRWTSPVPLTLRVIKSPGCKVCMQRLPWQQYHLWCPCSLFRWLLKLFFPLYYLFTGASACVNEAGIISLIGKTLYSSSSEAVWKLLYFQPSPGLICNV